MNSYLIGSHSQNKPTPDLKKTNSTSSSLFDSFKFLSPPPKKTSSISNLKLQPISPASCKISELSIATNTILNEIHETFSENNKFERQNTFHKSKEYVDRKLQIKQSIKENRTKSEHYKKLNSIIGHTTKEDNFYITQEDLKQNQVTHFLLSNRRNFGESIKNSVKVNKKKKKKRALNAPSQRQLSFAELLSPGISKKCLGFAQKREGSGISNSTKEFISNELKKMWKHDDQYHHERKKRVLEVKLMRLDKIMDQLDLSDSRYEKLEIQKNFGKKTVN